MIKKISLIKTLKDKYKINVDVLKVQPPIEFKSTTIDYLTGGFYLTAGYNMYAFYISDENGIILNEEPFIHDEGVNSYFDIFKLIGYTYI